MSSNSSNSGSQSSDQRTSSCQSRDQSLSPDQCCTTYCIPNVQQNMFQGPCCPESSQGIASRNNYQRRLLAEQQQKPKRTRTEFNDFQKQILSAEFARHQYIDQDRRRQLASLLKLTERNIKVWFQNRRMSAKKGVVSSSETAITEPVEEFSGDCNEDYERTNYATMPPIGVPHVFQHYATVTPYFSNRPEFQCVNNVVMPIEIYESTNGMDCPPQMLPVSPYEVQVVPSDTVTSTNQVTSSITEDEPILVREDNAFRIGDYMNVL